MCASPVLIPGSTVVARSIKGTGFHCDTSASVYEGGKKVNRDTTVRASIYAYLGVSPDAL